MFAWWGTMVTRRRWAVLVAGALFVIVGATWGTGVFGSVRTDVFGDPAAESQRAVERIDAEVGRVTVDALVLYGAGSSVDDPAVRTAITSTLDAARQRPEIERIVSYYDTGDRGLVATDGRATYALVYLKTQGSTDELEAVRDHLDAPGLTTRIGGPTAINADIGGRVGEDIARAEMYSMPILVLLLILIFGGVVAASTPLLVGGLAILGAFVATRLLTLVTDVSVFAINVITLIGLGLAIDYALLIVSRFREELVAGRDPADAVRRTMVTAGRTVAVSGLTVALAMASLLIFPQVFLRSMGFGGLAAVLVAMLASLTVLPALLAVLGHRINALGVRRRRASGPRNGWARLGYAVMRRPVLFVLGTVAILAVLATPFLRAEFGGADARVLPTDVESRIVADTVAADFPSSPDTIPVLIGGGDAADAAAFAQRVGDLPGVGGAQVTVGARSAMVSVAFDGSTTAEAARELVRDIRALPAPDGTEVLVGGAPAEVVDMLDSLADRLPWMALLAGLTTMLVLFLAFGSLVLPVKAVLMNVVSIGASFGAVVWVFQDGHLSGLLGFTPTGDLEASQLILMLAILFGLSTDYEVFLLSRVREEWDRSGDNTTAVAGGLQRTGGIITSLALLLIVVIGGFATGGITFIKMIGVGMIVALIVDATLVRALLVPATMRLLGRANWWLPGPLDRFYRRFGFKEESPAEPERELVSV